MYTAGWFDVFAFVAVATVSEKLSAEEGTKG